MHLSSYIGKYWTGAEVIYAVIIAMTFTSVLRTYIAIPGGSYFPMIYSALFCCIAWGIADGSFYTEEKRLELYRDLILHLEATGKKETVSTRDALYMILGTSLISTASGGHSCPAVLSVRQADPCTCNVQSAGNIAIVHHRLLQNIRKGPLRQGEIRLWHYGHRHVDSSDNDRIGRLGV